MGKTKKSTKSKTHVINFGKFHEHIQLDKKIKTLHKLAEEEKKLLIKDFKEVKGIEKEWGDELGVIRHFEEKLQSLIENVVYLEGYIQQIEDGNSMLKINPSVKELGTKLEKNIEEVEKFSSSLRKEEEKILELAKHVKHILIKAKRYLNVIFN